MKSLLVFVVCLLLVVLLLDSEPNDEDEFTGFGSPPSRYDGLLTDYGLRSASARHDATAAPTIVRLSPVSASTNDMSDIVLTTFDDQVATVTLNRPDKLNALSLDLWVRLGEVIDQLSANDSLRCIVLRGAGERAFSPGADITLFETERANLEQARVYGARMHHTMGSIASCRHPTIAMIQGVCIGGGLELACMCDLRYCAESSRFGIPINRLGVIMAYPEIMALIDLVGRATALEILLEGRIFAAEEAQEKRLVHRVVADSQLESETYAAAARIAAAAPLSNQMHKKFARRLLDPRPLSPEEFDEGFSTANTEDYQEGRRAFIEKRKPQFKGR